MGYVKVPIRQTDGGGIIYQNIYVPEYMPNGESTYEDFLKWHEEREKMAKKVKAEEQKKIMKEHERFENADDLTHEEMRDIAENGTTEKTSDVEYPQAQEENEYRYISPAWLDEVARGLTAGAEKYPGETWRTIPAKEHAWRAVRHLILYLKGDTHDTHLINASMRCMMAFVTAAAEQNRETWEKRMSEKGCG